MKKYINVLFIAVLITIAFESIAQPIAKNSISGSIIDEISKEPLPFATVIVKSLSDSTVSDGQITDENGTFSLKQVPSGRYELTFHFLGYEPFSIIRNVTGDKNDIDLGSIVLRESAATLDAVEVVAERSTVEQKIDRKVINIGKDLATSGPTAADLMVNLPSVDVDQDGTISLRGNDNVMILLDGKPTNLTSSQLLQQIPSNTIKKVELITNPSAKYVPEGMSGIINIVLHKNLERGLNANISSGVTIGEETRFNGSINANYRISKLNFFVNYGNTSGDSPFWGTISRPTDSSNEVWLTESNRISNLLKFGLDLDLNDKTRISGYTVLNEFKNDSYRTNDILFPNNESSNFGQEYGSLLTNNSTTYNFDIKHTGENFSLEFEADHNHLLSSEAADFIFFGSNVDVDQAAELIERERTSTTLNVDFERTWGNNTKLESGLEARIQKTNNSYITSNINFENSNFDFDRNIYAAYINWSQSLGSWSYQLGSRFEEFDLQSLFDEENSPEAPFNQTIYSIYPSASLSYVPDPSTRKNAFNLNLSRRVDRPNLDQVNPMRAWSSARVTNIGNPFLVPQFTSSIELNYTRQLSDGSITSGIFYRRIEDEITRFGFNDPENVENVLFPYNNYRDNSAYGLELSGSYQLASWWSFTSSLDLYTQLQRGVAQDAEREVRNVLFNFRMNHSWKVNKKLTFQMVSLYRGANTNLQYKTLDFYFINFGARHSVFENKGTISVNFNDIFHTQRFSFKGERPVIQEGSFNWDSQTVFIGYSHRFGSGKRLTAQRKRRDKNEKKNTGGL